MRGHPVKGWLYFLDCRMNIFWPSHASAVISAHPVTRIELCNSWPLRMSESDGGQVKKILKHVHFWNVKPRPPPRANAPPVHIHLDYSDCQIPSCEDYLYKDPDYPIEDYGS